MWARPCLLLDPTAGALRQMRHWRHTLHHVESDRALAIDAVVLALEPAVPPAQRLLQEAHGRLRLRLVRIEMRPRADRHFVRHRKVLRQAKRRVPVQVRPTTPKPDRTLDGCIVEAHRGMLPVIVEPLVLEPDLRPEPLGLEPLAPHSAPALAHDLRVRRTGVEELHDAAPPEVVVEQGSARVVDALREAIVGAHDGDDRGRAPADAVRPLAASCRRPRTCPSCQPVPSTRVGGRSRRSPPAHRPAPG